MSQHIKAEYRPHYTKQYLIGCANHMTTGHNIYRWGHNQNGSLAKDEQLLVIKYNFKVNIHTSKTGIP